MFKKLIKNKFYCALLCFAWAALFTFEGANAAEKITLKKVLKSSVKSYPKIIESIEKINANKGKVQSAEGSFDLELNNFSQFRTNGFYDGQIIDTKLVKPFAAFNSKVYAGYRSSDGIFPIYEDYYNTNDGGEYNIGVIFSLLRNRDIDEKRLKLYNSEISLSIAEYNLILQQILVQHMAMTSYFEWLAAGKALEVYKELYEIADKRQEGLKVRAEKGDVAEIYLTENLQYIYRRKSQYNEAERYFLNAGNKLSLFYRDKKNKPIEVKKVNLPKTFSKMPKLNYSKIRKEIPEISNLRPDLKAINNQIDIEKNKLKIGDNRIMPQLDVNIEASDDRGRGSLSRDETEGLFKLNISVPLQRRAGLGLIQEAQANIRRLEQKQKLMNEQIAVEIKNIATNLKNTKKIAELTDAEVIAAKKMAKAEVEKFNNGASDFFVVNMREEKTADAKVKNIKAKLEFFKSLTDYYASTMKLEKLFID